MDRDYSPMEAGPDEPWRLPTAWEREAAHRAARDAEEAREDAEAGPTTPEAGKVGAAPDFRPSGARETSKIDPEAAPRIDSPRPEARILAESSPEAVEYESSRYEG